jgi:hypothetical protein
VLAVRPDPPGLPAHDAGAIGRPRLSATCQFGRRHRAALPCDDAKADRGSNAKVPRQSDRGTKSVHRRVTNAAAEDG